MMQALITISLMMLIAMLLPGIINRVRALLAGRRGVSLYQHISNVELLMRKSAVYSHTTTVLFRAAPSVYLATSIAAILLLPLGYLIPVVSFKGDIVAFCYLLALGRLSLILAAMDTGSSFEGMGASREALYGALIEPAMLVVLGTLALITGNTSFGHMFSGIGGVSAQMIIVIALVCYALYKILIVEAGRIPVDDPRTHLELTMIHEVMVLDYCGVDLAFITIAGWLKMAALALLAGNAAGALFSNSVFAVAGFTMLVPVAIGVSESFRARNRMSRNTTYILTILAVAMLVLLVAFMLVRNIEFA